MNPIKYLSLSDLNIPVDKFSRSRVTLSPGSRSLLSQSDIADENGYVSFIAVKAVYPSTVVESRKYINWTYQGNINNMDHIVTGKQIGRAHV